MTRSLVALALLSATLVSLLVPQKAQAGAWTLEEGAVWWKAAYFRLDSNRIFANKARSQFLCDSEPVSPGDRIPYSCDDPDGGRFVANVMFLEAAIGIHRRFDLRLQVPVIAKSFFDDEAVGTGDREKGIGDLRVSGQVLLLPEPVVLSLGWEVKAPTGEFEFDLGNVPLGEGQWDLAFKALIAKSFLNGKMWAGAEVGYRIRLPNDDLSRDGIDFGDEVLAVIEGGGRPVKWLYIPLRLDLQWGFENEEKAFPGTRQNDRKVLSLQPGLMVNPFAHLDNAVLKELGIEWGVRIPLWGRGWPADPVYFVGISGKVRAFTPYSG